MRMVQNGERKVDHLPKPVLLSTHRSKPVFGDVCIRDSCSVPVQQNKTEIKCE